MEKFHYVTNQDRDKNGTLKAVQTAMCGEQFDIDVLLGDKQFACWPSSTYHNRDKVNCEKCIAKLEFHESNKNFAAFYKMYKITHPQVDFNNVDHLREFTKSLIPVYDYHFKNAAEGYCAICGAVRSEEDKYDMRAEHFHITCKSCLPYANFFQLELVRKTYDIKPNFDQKMTDFFYKPQGE